MLQLKEYVVYRDWSLSLVSEVCDTSNTTNGDGWKWINSGLRSELTCFFLSSSVSPLFEKLELFLLELCSPRPMPD